MPTKQLVFALLFFVFGTPFQGSAQQQLMIKTLESSPNSKEYFKISDKTPGTGMKGTKGFLIRKIERSSGKDLFKVELAIPAGSVMRYPLSNGASFDLAGDRIVVVFDVIQKSAKDSYVCLVNTTTGVVTENVPVFSDKIKSMFDFHEVVYKTVCSPDFSKVAIIKDNLSPTVDVNTEISIFELPSLKLLSTKNLGQKYNGTKRVLDLPKTSLDNSGTVHLLFNLMNEKTKMTTKSYVAELPITATELQNIREQNGSALADGSSQTSHGRFYKTLQDFANDKPMGGLRIKNGSYSYSVIKGNDFKLIDEKGNIQQEDAKNLPSDLFTYKREDYTEPILMRIIDKKPYIVLAVGKFTFYALYLDNQLQFYTEEWESSDLKSYKEKILKDYLKQYGLLEEYEKTMPKREMSDSVNGWFNKNLTHTITYINKLNKKMAGK